MTVSSTSGKLLRESTCVESTQSLNLFIIAASLPAEFSDTEEATVFNKSWKREPKILHVFNLIKVKRQHLLRNHIGAGFFELESHDQSADDKVNKQ